MKKVLAVGVVSASVLLMAASASGQENAQTLEPFAGHYTYAGGKKGQAKLDAEIEKVVADMNFLIRGFAADELRAFTKPYKYIKVSATNGNLTMQSDRHGPWVSGVKGTAFKARYAGEDVSVDRVMRDGGLVERIKATHGTLTRTFRLGKGGELMTMSVVMRSPELDRPLHYTVAFRPK